MWEEWTVWTVIWLCDDVVILICSKSERPDPLGSDRRKIVVEIRIWPPHIHLVRFKSSYLISWSAPGENNHLIHVLKMPKTNRQESPFRNYIIKNHMMTFLCSSTPSYSFHGSNSSHFKDSGWVKRSWVGQHVYIHLLGRADAPTTSRTMSPGLTMRASIHFTYHRLTDRPATPMKSRTPSLWHLTKIKAPRE